jgi:hypothetical protein
LILAATRLAAGDGGPSSRLNLDASNSPPQAGTSIGRAGNGNVITNKTFGCLDVDQSAREVFALLAEKTGEIDDIKKGLPAEVRDCGLRRTKSRKFRILVALKADQARFVALLPACPLMTQLGHLSCCETCYCPICDCSHEPITALDVRCAYPLGFNNNSVK